MLIHGRLLVTEHGVMLDEVKSLLQKALRRKDSVLIKRAAKELTCGKKDQLPWKSIVTFIFEDHCLNHVDVLQKLEQLYRSDNKRGCIEILSRCYTCRYSACLQVVAVSDQYRNYEEFWDCKLPVDPTFTGLVLRQKKTINCDRLLMFIVKFWKCWKPEHSQVLASLFGLVNMAAKVEGRQLTTAGDSKLLVKGIKKPSLYHLVFSLLHHHAEDDEYMKSVLLVCLRFSTIPNAPQGLIMFSALAQKIFKTNVVNKPMPDMKLEPGFWVDVGVLETMPDWAVDKHTYRGKFGKSSAELFKRKYKALKLTEVQIEEFHGLRPKVGIEHFFDVGCLCENEILPENPIWETTKEIYFKQRPVKQKTAKMTHMYYHDLRKKDSVVFFPSDYPCDDELESDADNASSDSEKSKYNPSKPVKRSLDTSEKTVAVVKKQKKLTDYMASDLSGSSVICASSSGSLNETEPGTTQRKPRGPLLQLPTGSGKVYTILDTRSNKVWKGPYKSKERMMLCTFYHTAMKEIFQDKHTLEFEEEGPYIIFPLLMSKNGKIKVTKRAFYDCIAKRDIPEEDGLFVERAALGLVQLHKLPPSKVRALPVSVWAHFAFRYILNVGDTGLYNAIATDDLGVIYGIDMEENRKQVKGSDVINLLFGKLPRKDIVPEIKQALCENVEGFYGLIRKEFDMDKLSRLYRSHGLKDETDMCKKRLVDLQRALERLCKEELGV